VSAAAAARIERILRERFQPLHFELRDDSHKHVGHAGATSGGGHFHVVIVAQAFEGKNRLEQHRLVNEALDDLFGHEIHALGLTTRAPSER
jgi:BolA protein